MDWTTEINQIINGAMQQDGIQSHIFLLNSIIEIMDEPGLSESQKRGFILKLKEGIENY